MQDYLDVIYKASENRAITLDQRLRFNGNMSTRVPEGLPPGYFIYCPSQLPGPIQIPNNPIMNCEDTPNSTQAIQINHNKRYLESYDKNENDRTAKIAKKEPNDPNYVSKNGFYSKINEIMTDLHKYQKIFDDNQEYFNDMLRPRENISLLFEEIAEDLNIIKNKNYDICKYANNCGRTECCAFLNPDDIFKIINAYKYFDIDIYDFKQSKKIWRASVALRSLKALHNATWYIVSRKRLANRIFLKKK